jgi:hypothetical protein
LLLLLLTVSGTAPEESIGREHMQTGGGTFSTNVRQCTQQWTVRTCYTQHHASDQCNKDTACIKQPLPHNAMHGRHLTIAQNPKPKTLSPKPHSTCDIGKEVSNGCHVHMLYAHQAAQVLHQYNRTCRVQQPTPQTRNISTSCYPCLKLTSFCIPLVCNHCVNTCHYTVLAEPNATTVSTHHQESASQAHPRHVHLVHVTTLTERV